ncbi:replication initiation factor domain-containing protein [Vagococcus lutrae]|uniref:replication initiation factor domain-containing protein n=1 Tax=Vagococcus lutrae TaxID=81947 RepID=UPI00200CF292|nr:replication initiation factor domain-containing protein [Vagococcus lutrae]
MISFIDGDAFSVANFLFQDMVEDFRIMESSFKGFRHVYTNGLLFIHYDNRGDQDVLLLEIKSKGCRSLEKIPNYSWKQFFQKISVITRSLPITRYNVKRIDVAIDSSTSETLTPDRLRYYFNRQLISSRWQKIRMIQEFRITSSEATGNSVYLGNRSSDFSILVYDKQLESNSKELRYRTELRFKNSWGKEVMKVILNNSNNFSSFLESVLRRYIQFRSSQSKNKEIRRRPLAKWYEAYLSYVNNMTLHKL